jgi:hypothetical protein
VDTPKKDQKWLWTALAAGSADVVEKIQRNLSTDFDWNGSSKTYGTPLMAAIFSGPRTSDTGCTDFVTDGEAQFQTRLKLLRWMITDRGCDPSREETASCCADKSWSITDDAEVHSQTRTLNFRGHSALSALLEVRMRMLAAEGEWRPDINRVDRILEVFSETVPKPKHVDFETEDVHSGVVERWEKIYNDEALKDIEIRCLGMENEELGRIPAHVLVLSSASNVLHAMLSGGMREGTARSDGGMRTISVECRPDVMRLFLSLLYTGGIHASDEAEPDVDLMVGCLYVAHRWDVQDVVQMLVRQIEHKISLANLDQVWECAIRLGQPDLLPVCGAFAQNEATEVQALLEAGKFGERVREELAERGMAPASAESPAKKRRKSFGARLSA